MKLLKRGDVTVEKVVENTQSHPNIAAMYKFYISPIVFEQNIKVTLGGDKTIHVYLRDMSKVHAGKDNPTIFSTGHLWKKFCYDDSINILISEYDYFRKPYINVVLFNSNEYCNKVVYKKSK